MSLNSILVLIISTVEIEGVYKLSTTTTERNEREIMSDARVEVVAIDRETTATLSEVSRDSMNISRGARDGKVPFYTKILPILRGERVTVYRVYTSIQTTYGEDSISRMRVYKWLNSLVTREIATKEFNQFTGEDEYIVK